MPDADIGYARCATCGTLTRRRVTVSSACVDTYVAVCDEHIDRYI